MHCIQFRPSLRFFQGAQSAADTGIEDIERVPNASPAVLRGVLLQSKEDRLLHVESLRSVLVHILIPTEVVAHFVGGDKSSILSDVLSFMFGVAKPTASSSCGNDLELVLSLPSYASVSQAISVIFETLLNLREKTGCVAELHKDSLYSKISRGVVKCDPHFVALAMLQSDLTLGVCDAAGNVLQILKRLYSPKSGSTSADAYLPPSPSVTQIANYFQSLHCNAFSMAPSQKTILNILSSFVPPVEAQKGNRTVIAAAQEAAFQMPFLLKLYVPAERKMLRRLQLQEEIFRERLVAQSFVFLFSFAVPYFEVLQSDVSFRTDWIVFQSHCRHRLHISERESRVTAEQSVIVNCESSRRDYIVVDEENKRAMQLVQLFEQLTLTSCWEASRQRTIEDSEVLQRHTLQVLFRDETTHMHHLGILQERVNHFVHSSGFQMEEDSRLAMLREYHCTIKMSM
jgi:hypothetical protein